MFLTTTLGHYQLPRSDAAPTPARVLPDDQQRGAAGSSPAELPPTEITRAAERVIPPMAYKQWLKLLTGYEAGARPDAQSPEGDADRT
ncbi:hypothetical protein [Paracoccus beibuensis]|uniref:hypothetical protein n=1 Tax=Paracoccus beibuensis TaxID=547602 RepID=UPI00223E95A5|nr:hypothetical protein [Paracoccus beibuensis]